MEMNAYEHDNAAQNFNTFQPAVKPPFIITKTDVIIALLSFAMGYLFLRRFNDFYMSYDVDRTTSRIVLNLLFLALVTVLTEIQFHARKKSAESRVWFACLLFSSAGVIFDLTGVWSIVQIVLFQSGFFVLWLLSRAGILLEGQSSHLFPVDAFNGFITIPFASFGLRARTLFTAARTRRKTSKKSDGLRIGLTVSVLFLCIPLFCLSIRFLRNADAAFADWLDRKLNSVYLAGDLLNFFFAFLLSVPIGAYLHGLIGGAKRKPLEKLEQQKARTYRFLAFLKKVPAGVWVAVIGIFSLLYAMFFAFQTGYLLGAFRGQLPEGFIVSEYARRGFFELCKVSVVNFVLLWLATRTGECTEHGRTAIRIVSVVLLVENLLFSTISLSKLVMYIRTFGFTPRRLESSWLVCVIFAACAGWMINILSDKPVFRKWLFFSAVSLSLLCLVP